MKKIIKRLLLTAVWLTVLMTAIIMVCDIVVSNAADNRLYNRVEDVPTREVGLVLGTSPVSYWTGRRNLYYDARIHTAAELYKADKVRRLVVSGGDYRVEGEYGYDEPACMRDSLIKQGVDSSDIILDYHGTRTMESISNMRDKYHTESFIVISQEYHNERALYQARHLGIDAIACNAPTPSVKDSWIRNRTREALARVKLFLDLYL